LPTALLEDGVYVPLLSGFYAIDFIWKHNRTVWCVQVHVTPHDDVLSTLKSMCLEAQWQLLFDDIYLLYLSPEEKVAKVRALKKQKQLSDPSEADCINIEVIIATKDNLSCVENLQWPEGCSCNG
jgi:hypothetical protein